MKKQRYEDIDVLPCPFCGRTELKAPLEMSAALAEELNYKFAIMCDCGVQGASANSLEEANALFRASFR